MEKTSLLVLCTSADMGIGKDFLTSWKSMSVTEDDPMDFALSKVTKGNKNAFGFDNLDVDFNLDNDFGKISSFSIDIPDLDVSSPVKKSAKPTEKSKEVSMDEKIQGKSNRSTFQFDFDEFDDSSFGPSLMKKAKKTNANRDAKLSLSPSGSLGLNETIAASEGETTPKLNSQCCAEPDSQSKEKLQTRLVEVHTPSNSEFSKVQATNVGATTSPQKKKFNSTQETFQENRPKERIGCIELYAKDKCRNSPVQFVSENSSTYQTGSSSQDEFGCLAGKERTNSGREQSLCHDKTDIGIDCGDSQIGKLAVDLAGSQSNDGVNTQFSGNNSVRVEDKYNGEPGQDDSQYEQTSTSASKQVLLEKEADVDTMDMTLELVTRSNSETTGGGREMLEAKSATEIFRSKYFRELDEAKSQLQHSTLCGTKIATFDRKGTETVQLSCANKGATMGDKAMPDKASLHNISSECFDGLHDTQSHLQQDSSSQVKVGADGSKRITTSQPCTADERGRPNSYDTKRFLTSTSRLLDMDVAKGGLVLKGSENSVKDLNTFREPHGKGTESRGKSDCPLKAVPREQIEDDSVHTRTEGSFKGLTNNSGECYSDNTDRTLTGTSMLHVKDGSKNNMKYFSTLRKSQTIHPPSKSTLQKNTKLVTNLRQGADLKENAEPRMAHHAEIREQATLSPTLKRKNIEESGTNLIMLKPPKRLFLSPGGSRIQYIIICFFHLDNLHFWIFLLYFNLTSLCRNFRELSEKLVDKENLPDNYTGKVLNNFKSSCKHFTQKVDMKEEDTPLQIDSDTNVENADACAKELENLVDMLKKKHEEAKEILVRAVVNNNKLLMLNHSIYEEKMIEKFGALWLSK
ncbi:uncharacterized protein At4g18490 isoform X2 [Daucus carota subsp. sativus]|uniref:uncharacterized protein At4g18490 isoform X2 n=1 Tax=Daucus carota subsp. sativus TaxID=79200 RepID=UPI0030830369